MEWNGEPGDSYECPSFLTTEKAACALDDTRTGWSALKAIRWPAPSSERAGTGKSGVTVLFDTDNEIYNSGTTSTQWPYRHARLKGGLVKDKHIDESFGSKTALVWLRRSGNADQLFECLGVEGTKKRTQNRIYVFIQD